MMRRVGGTKQGAEKKEIGRGGGRKGDGVLDGTIEQKTGGGATQKADRDFSRNHAMAIHLNALAMVGTVWYGFALASRITIVL